MTRCSGPKRGKLAGPIAGSAAVVGLMLTLARRYYQLCIAGGADPGPSLVVALLFCFVTVIGVAVGWLRYLKARRDHRNRRKPMSLG